MRSRLRVFVTAAVVVGTLGVAADAVLRRLAVGWVTRDLVRTTEAAVRSTRTALSDALRRADTASLRGLLTDLSHREFSLGAAVCQNATDFTAHTDRFPVEARCSLLGTAEPFRTAEGDFVVATQLSAPLDPVIVALAVEGAFLQQRIAQARAMVLAAITVLAMSALIVAAIDRWRSNRSWTRELHEVLGPLTALADRRSLLRTVFELKKQVEQQRTSVVTEGAWTQERLRDVVKNELGGAKIIILANREPVIHQRLATGSTRVLRPASGLVSALEPVVRACAGSWVAHGTGTADRDFVDANDRLTVTPLDHAYTLRRVWMSPDEEAGYYYGFANEGLWPLCHVAHARPSFRANDMEHYRGINERFVDAVCSEADQDDPIVLVQDYHFALAPRLLRKRLPNATIVAFWHIPWPNAERFGICPWREEILEGLLGASILGFHTQQHCNNFADAVESFIEARVDRERAAVVRKGKRTLVRPYPISIEWPLHWADEAPPPRESRHILSTRHALGDEVILGIGVDRLDYTKGIEERFLAVERLLEIDESLRGRFCFIQLAAPSRDRIPRYQEFAESVRALVDRINGRFSTGTWAPILFLHEHHDRDDVARYYRAAQFCYVSSLHDGMNLVAKEFVASRSDEQGVLILSSFTGAARELTEALLVNPYDIEYAAQAMLASLRMGPDEQRARMRAMRATVAADNIYRWAGAILSDAADTRQRARLGAWLTRIGGEAS